MQWETDGDVSLHGDEHRQPDRRHLRHHHDGPDAELDVASVEVPPAHDVQMRRWVHVDERRQDKDTEQEDGVRNGDGTKDEEHRGMSVRAQQHHEGQDVSGEAQQTAESCDPDADDVGGATRSVVALGGVLRRQVGSVERRRAVGAHLPQRLLASKVEGVQ